MASIHIQLDKLINMDIEQREFEGKMVDYIVFPAEINGVTKFKNHYFLNFWMTKRKIDKNGSTHYLSLRYAKSVKDVYWHVKELGLWDRVKLIGNVFAGSDYKWKGGKEMKDSDYREAFDKD